MSASGVRCEHGEMVHQGHPIETATDVSVCELLSTDMQRKTAWWLPSQVFGGPTTIARWRSMMVMNSLCSRFGTPT